MEKEQEQINEFIIAAGKNYPNNGPEIPSEQVIRSRINFMAEELEEFAKACGYQLQIKLEVQEGIQQQEVNFVGAMDALADLTYFTKGTYSAFGVSGGPIFQIVHKANMKKFGPGGYLDPHSHKWIKPPDFVPPEPQIAEELERQREVAVLNEAVQQMKREKAEEQERKLESLAAKISERDWEKNRLLGKLNSSVQDFEETLKNLAREFSAGLVLNHPKS